MAYGAPRKSLGQHFLTDRNILGAIADAAEVGPRDTVIEVADTGPGISDRVREHLFEAFADGGRSDGTGLGLAIAHDLVRNHGGDIGLERSGPAGTVFRLRLPDPPDPLDRGETAAQHDD